MKYFQKILERQPELFFIEPQTYDRTKLEDFQYALGANLYMNGLRDLYATIKKNRNHVNTITICFEDAISENDIPQCEEELLKTLRLLAEEPGQIPTLFIRVRNYEHFLSLSNKISGDFGNITGFVFPKFDSENGHKYLQHLVDLQQRYQCQLYAMPILEGEKIIYHETRREELQALNKIFADFPECILNIRLGGADFSALFGLRRNVSTAIYQLTVVNDCLADIINFWGRTKNRYVISAPVFEYFHSNINSVEMQGLLREIELDHMNGLCGKTVIHPTQAHAVNCMSVVSYIDYQDAQMILNHDNGAVHKSSARNKMNEKSPHYNWAKKIICQAKIFGVLQPGLTPYDLLRLTEVE